MSKERDAYNDFLRTAHESGLLDPMPAVDCAPMRPSPDAMKRIAEMLKEHMSADEVDAMLAYQEKMWDVLDELRPELDAARLGSKP